MRAPKNNRKSSNRDYEIGKGKPPKAFQFKPGQSGNPRGRPKGSHNFATDVRAMLKMPVKVKRNGKSETKSTQMGSLIRLREEAFSGKTRLLIEVLALAALYNNEEFSALTTKVSADDETLFDILAERIRSGAIPTSRTPSQDEEPDEPNQADGPEEPDKPTNDAEDGNKDDES